MKKLTAISLALTMSLAALSISTYGRPSLVLRETSVQNIDLSDGVEVKDYESLAKAIDKAGAKVYITSDIKMADRIQLEKGNVSVIGVPDENGVLPVLDFEDMKGAKDIINESSSDSDVGIRITSAGNVVKNIVVEKAHDNGIQIKGTGAVNNLIESVIVRYNNDSGIQVTGGACGNTLKNIYNYRNCDVFTRGGNADGFAIKLSAGPETTKDRAIIEKSKNVCIDCYAWENSDDGWDSFDYPSSEDTITDGKKQTAPDKWTYRLDYINCMAWNNGDPANCLGYTDYVKGLPLDENLPFIRRFKAVYPDKYTEFVKQYNDGSLCERTDSVGIYYNKIDEFFPLINTNKGEIAPGNIAISNWSGNPNGFKLGSKYSQNNTERYMTNCIAFDHKAKGFDKNMSSARIWAENCISFDNRINYHLETYTAEKWNNIFGWNGAEKDNLPPKAANVMNTGSDVKEEAVRAAAQRISNYAENNKIILSNIFDNVFSE